MSGPGRAVIPFASGPGRHPCDASAIHSLHHRQCHRNLLMKPARLILLLALPLLPAALTGCRLIGGVVQAALPLAGAKLAFACLPDHTAVDTPDGPKRISDLRAGDTVTGFSGQPVRILQLHSYLENPETVFLKVTFDNSQTVELCGMHRIAGIRARSLSPGQSVAGRTVTGITSRTGVTRSCDLLTEDEGYQINGIPVNSMIEEMHAAAASGMRRLRD